MATALERRDEVEQLLAAVDHDYLTVYGPHPEDWSKGVRGEYLATLRSRRTMDHETHPARPRRASAGRRRRHRKQLAYRIRQTAPGAETVLCTPVWTDAKGPMRLVYVVTARDVEQQSIRLPRGGSHRIADLLQGAYPKAAWRFAQTWHSDTGELTRWGQATRAFRDTADAGYVESLDEYDARLTVREAQ